MLTRQWVSLRTACSISSTMQLSVMLKFTMKIQKLSPAELGYIAGIIDGEGCINISVKKQRQGESLTCRLTIGNTNEELLKTIQEWIGGDIYTAKIRYPEKPQ